MKWHLTQHCFMIEIARHKHILYEALNTINSKKNLHQNWIQNKNSTPSNYANFLRSDSTRYLFRNKISKLFIAHHSITYNDDHFMKF
jgi:hypothetical protein